MGLQKNQIHQGDCVESLTRVDQGTMEDGVVKEARTVVGQDGDAHPVFRWRL